MYHNLYRNSVSSSERKVVDMKQQTEKYRRKRFIAAICAITVLVGTSAGLYAFSANAYSKSDKTDSSSSSTTEQKTEDDGIISASGTITSSQLNDQLGLKDTSVRLTIEKVLAEEGASVTSGTKLYQLTSDSVTRAKKTLESELQSANNALLKQKTSYQSDKIKAYTLYQSELLLEKTAQQEYDSGIASLDSELKNAYDSYKEALDTVNNTPSEISKKKSELSSKEKSAKTLEEKKTSAEKESGSAEKNYTTAAEKYNSIVQQYNSSASVVKYLGNALGKDTSGIKLAQTVTVSTQGQGNKPSGEGERGNLPTKPSSTTPEKTSDQNAFTPPDETEKPGDQQDPKPDEKKDDSSTTDLSALYEKAYKEYSALKQSLDKQDSTLKTAEKQYKTASESLSKISTELSEAQSSISSLEREISSLESSLSKAKSNLTKLRSQYDSLNASYETDKLTLKNKLDTDTATYKNAEYNYKVTINTIEQDLADAQTAYDTAAENLSIFEKELAEGYICAKQDGTIDTLNYQQGKNANISTPSVYYVDRSELKTTVELDQYDVTEINIGDTVIIYSSETGVSNGRITAVAAGESKSLADVRFNVTVTADEDTNLYSGQSVTVYFNYSGLDTNDLKDKSSDKQSDKDSSSSDRKRPDFNGEMPEGFDPSNMPDSGGRKDD